MHLFCIHFPMKTPINKFVPLIRVYIIATIFNVPTDQFEILMTDMRWGRVVVKIWAKADPDYVRRACSILYGNLILPCKLIEFVCVIELMLLCWKCTHMSISNLFMDVINVKLILMNYIMGNINKGENINYSVIIQTI